MAHPGVSLTKENKNEQAKSENISGFLFRDQERCPQGLCISRTELYAAYIVDVL